MTSFAGVLGACARQWAALALALAVSFAIFCSNAISHRALVENRGVVDDICYLRQAHLFRTLGAISGLDTDHESVRYVQKTAAQLGLQGKLITDAACHTYISATDKTIIQYPPGTGAALALFAPGYQTSGLYLLGSLAVLMLLVVALARARSGLSLSVLAGVGWLTLYLMVNPSKASYSMAITMPLCVALAFATVSLFHANDLRSRAVASGIAGLILGLAITFRLSSALLGIGFAVVLGVQFCRRPARENFLIPLLFGVGVILTASPTLFSNWINAGSPFSTGYAGPDVAPPQLSFEMLTSMLRWYLRQTHGVLFILAIAAICIGLAILRDRRATTVAAVTFATNMAYFLTHPIESQYYSVPPAMFAIWTVVASFAAETPAVWAPVQRMQRLVAAAAVGTAAIAVFAVALVTRTVALEAAAVDFPDRAVIWMPGFLWGEGDSRRVEYEMHRHAATGLDRLSDTEQDIILGAVTKDARPQYLVGGSPAMTTLIERTKARHVGQLFGNDVYQLPRVELSEQAEAHAAK